MRASIGVFAAACVLALACSFGCSGRDDGDAQAPGALEETAPDTTAPRSLYAIDALDALPSFYDHPWPSDLRRAADGTLLVDGFVNPRSVPFVNLYVKAARGLLRGFSPAAPGYLRFDSPIDETTLPKNPADATSSSSSVQLVDIDPASPEHGRRHPILLRAQSTDGVYVPKNTLAFIPAPGHPLRGGTRYALVVTAGLLAKGGRAFRPAHALAQILGQEPIATNDAAVQRAKATLGSAAPELAGAGIAPSSVAHLAVFTTQAPTDETERIRDFVVNQYAVPDVTSWSANDVVGGVLDVYQGEYGPSPDFQQGTVPFGRFGDGGGFVFGADGKPVVQRENKLRFALAVPNAAACPMPAAGYPIALYAHGTGGDYRSMLGARHEAEALAKRCIAAMGIDQPFHGTRPGSDPFRELYVFNVENPISVRANFSQAAIEVVQQARLFTARQIKVPAVTSRTGAEIRFDGSRVLFFGHSQGGINGPIFLAVDGQARGGVLSGSGAFLSMAFLEKKSPIDVVGIMREALALGPGEESQLDIFNPAIALAQTIVDPSDTVHYARKIITEPRAGQRPKSIFMTQGIRADGTGDTFAPPDAIELHATALGVPPAAPMVRRFDSMSWSGVSEVAIPATGLSGNLAGGAATGLLVQWAPGPNEEGHFVIYNQPKAMAQAARFMEALAQDPVARVLPP
jgi:hypothetical protein